MLALIREIMWISALVCFVFALVQFGERGAHNASSTGWILLIAYFILPHLFS